MTQARGSALWELGYRPFYLLAAIFAVLSIAIWIFQIAGDLPWFGQAGPYWHAHELIFGYALAVIAGFLFAIVRNWTGRPTPTGPILMAIVGLWVAARILAFTPWSVAIALANVGFALAVGVSVAAPLLRAQNRQNYFFIFLVLLITTALVLFHLSALGVTDLPEWVSLQFGIDAVLLMIAAVAGRVVPIYTNKAVSGARARRSQNVERMVIGGLLALLAADLAQLAGMAMVTLALALAAVHAWRLWRWDPRSALQVPLLWVLFIAYAWVPLYFVLRAAHAADWVARAVATHAFTIGVLGGLTMGMMIRTARAYTGRALRADQYDIAACLLIAASAAVRVVWPMIEPASQVQSSVYSGALWVLAFMLFVLRHGPALTQSR